MQFHFNTQTVSFILEPAADTGKMAVKGVVALDTQTGQVKKFFAKKMVINSLGATCNELLSTIGQELRLEVDSHEAGVTEPAGGALPGKIQPLVVDIRKRPGSSSFYFYQNLRGQIMICYSPDPPIVGYDLQETSHFLPKI